MIDLNDDCEIGKVGEKNIYNRDNSNRIKNYLLVSEDTTIDFPNFTSALNIKDNKKVWRSDSIGTLVFLKDDVYHTQQGIGLFSGIGLLGYTRGYSIVMDNFLRCMSSFCAMRLIRGDWVNHFDEYLAPNESHPKFREFELDSVIYSFFNSKSQQSSLRDVDYKGKKWNIKNEFFFMSKDEIENLANDNENDECYEDVKNNGEDRFVYKFIEEHKDEFSKEAIEVLEKAKELVRRSFKYRKFFNDDNPDYQIQNWDCGWYQIKAVLKQYMPNELKEFRELYKNFAEKMKPMVYELGFLRN